MQFDVVAIGEPIIDFTPLPASSSGNLVYEAFTGGGACNVLAQVAAYGGNSAIIGTVGADSFGEFLKQKLNAAGVMTPALHQTTVKNTGIGFVHLRNDGERSFIFYRNPEAQVELFFPEDETIVSSSKIFHFTSVSLSGSSIRESTFSAVGCARKHDVLVSFDVNHRASLWKDVTIDPKEQIFKGIAQSEIVKLSEEERTFLFGDVSNRECAAILHRYGVILVAISMGSKGCYFSYSKGDGECASIKVKMLDSTGCGDAFAGTMLAQLASYGGKAAIQEIPIDEMRRIFACANVAGAICASRYGSFSIMPTKDEIRNYLFA